MKNETVVTYSIDQVVRCYLKNRPIVDYRAQAEEIARWYSCGILTEGGEIRFVEDAVVISIETAS